MTARPTWVDALVSAGGHIDEAGEHGQWTVTYGNAYITDADCADGVLFVGSRGSNKGADIPEADLLSVLA